MSISKNFKTSFSKFVLTTKVLGFLSLFTSFVAFIPGQVVAEGFDNSAVGLRGNSMASAYQGIADDASAIYYNPGGLSLVADNQWNAEAYLVAPITGFNYSVEAPDPTTGQMATIDNGSNKIPLIPGVFISKKLKRIAFGLGFYVPYGGGGTKYEEFMNTPTNFEASAAIFALSPSFSFEIIKNKLAVGLTPSLYFGMMENKYMDPGDGTIPPSMFLSKNSGFAGVGASLGVLFKPITSLGIGLTLRSPVKVKMDGTLTVSDVEGNELMKNDTAMEFTLPLYLELGLGWKPIDRLTLGMFGSLIFHGMTDEIKTIMDDTSAATKTEFEHNIHLGLGAEFMFIEQLGARAGIKFLQSPSKEAGLNPATADVSQLVFNGGLTWNIVEQLAFDVTYFNVVGLERSRKTDLGGGMAMTETFDADHHILVGGLRFHY